MNERASKSNAAWMIINIGSSRLNNRKRASEFCRDLFIRLLLHNGNCSAPIFNISEADYIIVYTGSYDWINLDDSDPVYCKTIAQKALKCRWSFGSFLQFNAERSDRKELLRASLEVTIRWHVGNKIEHNSAAKWITKTKKNRDLLNDLVQIA